jgi:hypothetical protein
MDGSIYLSIYLSCILSVDERQDTFHLPPPLTLYPMSESLTDIHPDPLRNFMFFGILKRDFCPFPPPPPPPPLHQKPYRHPSKYLLFFCFSNSLVNFFVCLCKGKKPQGGSIPEEGGKNAATNPLCHR